MQWKGVGEKREGVRVGEEGRGGRWGGLFAVEQEDDRTAREGLLYQWLAVEIEAIATRSLIGATSVQYKKLAPRNPIGTKKLNMKTEDLGLAWVHISRDIWNNELCCIAMSWTALLP